MTNITHPSASLIAKSSAVHHKSAMQRPHGGQHCSGCSHHLYKFSIFWGISAYPNRFLCALWLRPNGANTPLFNGAQEFYCRTLGSMLTICFLQETVFKFKQIQGFKVAYSKPTHCLPLIRSLQTSSPRSLQFQCRPANPHKNLAPTVDFLALSQCRVATGPIQRTKWSSPRSTKRNCRHSMLFSVNLYWSKWLL